MNTPTTLGLQSSFGFGDRLGLATFGHLDALRAQGGPIRGVFPQQSIREMTRTRRTAQQVMDDACQALDAEGFDEPFGADADHLKTEQDVDVTAAAGFTFFTIDPSDHVDAGGDAAWIKQYVGQTIDIPEGPTLALDEDTVQRTAVKYGKAVEHALSLAAYIAKVAPNHEIELSVDETDEPTTLAEHYIIADQCRQASMKLVSLAPRFIGDFEKGVDYKGDPRKLEESLNDHAAIARHLGPYKLSLHSGSDKLSIYAALARATRGMFHVKTAGTSYLEAIRVVARHDEALFRRIIAFARQRYDTDKATYHVCATVEGTPPDGGEREYLECWADVPQGKGFTEPGRQILHCTFGSVLSDTTLGPAVREVLLANPQTYREVLADHFARHLQALRAGM